MTKDEVMAELEKYGNAPTKKTFLRHGAREPFFGVKVGDLKSLVKKIKKNHQLSLDLYETGNSDAMYLAGLIADEKKITKADLKRWVKAAYWHMLSEYAVAWVAAESPHGWDLGLEWIESKEDMTSTAGWATLGSWIAIRSDADLDVPELKKLLDRVAKTIKKAPNRTRYAMNGFIMSCGVHVQGLFDKALETADRIGVVEVDMGDTACEVPSAAPRLRQMSEKGQLGKKKKQARC